MSHETRSSPEGAHDSQITMELLNNQSEESYDNSYIQGTKTQKRTNNKTRKNIKNK